jgi:four helix bundle protein
MDGRQLKVIKVEYESPGQAGKGGFEDLECYKLALDVMVNAHELAKRLPAVEKYDLSSQIRRSSKSVMANIAEGYGRYHFLDSLRYYSIARGELNETLSHFIAAQSLGYIPRDYFEQIYHLIRKSEAVLNGFMNHVRRKKAGAQEYGNKSVRDEYTEYDDSFVDSDFRLSDDLRK